MTKIDIISGFLGAGKTTLIKKLIEEAFKGEKLVLIENEFGEIGIDGGFLKDAGIQITEMNSGCICCSLVGDFGTALQEVITKYSPQRIIIEPSGVGKLSDVIRAVEKVKDENQDIVLNSFTTVADVNKCSMYMKNFGEFYNDQVESANTIILSRTQTTTEKKLDACVKALKEHNPDAVIITTPWEEITGETILKAMERKNDLVKELMEKEEICPTCGHHHDHEDHDHDHECCGHDHDHDHECCGHDHDHDHECCGHDHDHDHECCGHDHDHDHECCGHDHDHDHECCGHDHDHDHDHDCCGHDHHGHHHADDVFTSWGTETPHKYDEAELKEILQKLAGSDTYGMVLRAKGIVPSNDNSWLHFDLVPGEFEVRHGAADYTGRLCVIGAKLKIDEIEELFHIN
ncbi:CobW family GTP-binding protein [Anaerosporobacter faecicola]|uniref:GTP-binding protein n=1 Tax=Anaerosporobacter faecicola TaxID=2718714 RepID=UPI00143C59AF|nr:GTP-binding protein [Anaerosporobacter faecicola]